MKQNRPLLIPVFIVFMIVNGCNQKDASENPMPQESISAAEVHELKQWAIDGNAEAQYVLGLMYADGEGVIEDYMEAYKWALIAGRNGVDVEEIKIGLQFILTPDQISKAQKRAKKYVGQK